MVIFFLNNWMNASKVIFCSLILGFIALDTYNEVLIEANLFKIEGLYVAP